jgi:hypothetical protein
MTVIVWDDDGGESKQPDPSTASVLERIDALDGRARTLVTVLSGDAHAAVGGSVETGVVLYVTFDGVTFHLLSRGDGSSDPVRVTAGGQEGEYAARFVVDVELARRAMTAFVSDDVLDSELHWEVV